MKWPAFLLLIWTLTRTTYAQYQPLMPFQYPIAPSRTPAMATMRVRGPIALAAYPRWAPASSNQIPVAAPRPYKHPYMFVKPSPYMFRTPKPLGKYPPVAAFPGYWKAPAFAYRPTPLMKNFFGGPPMVYPGAALKPGGQLTFAMGQLAAGPTSAQKLYAATSPVKSVVLGAASPTKNILSAVYNKYQSVVPTTPATPTVAYSEPKATSQPLLGPSSTSPVKPTVSYPIRVEGEGGPIHTIPAPNLSNDKPIIVPDYSRYFENHAKKIKGGHKYEVTEDVNEKHYPDQSTNSVKYSPPASYFSSFTENDFLPQPQALQQVQPSVTSLTSQELYSLLHDTKPQQQSVDSYPHSIHHQQPQLQQHMSKQIVFDSQSPIQSYSAAIGHENALFRPDPIVYGQRVRERVLEPSTAIGTHRPAYHPFDNTNFNNHRPQLTHSDVLSERDADRLKAQLQSALGDDEVDLKTVHYNIIRNTQEGVVPHDSNDSDSSASFAVRGQIKFKPMTIIPDAFNGSLLEAIDDIASSSLTPDYVNALQNEAADKVDRSFDLSQIRVDSNVNNYRPYSVQNVVPESTQYFSDFTPSQGVAYQHDNDIKSTEHIEESHSPIRILVPDQYDDIQDVQPTENIRVSASMTANDRGKNDMTLLFDNADDENAVQYDDIEQNSPHNRTDEERNGSSIQVASPQAGNNKRSQDILVMLPKNSTNPTLDIVTKDWKTSIIIAPADTDNNSHSTEVGDFGNRVKSKE